MQDSVPEQDSVVSDSKSTDSRNLFVFGDITASFDEDLRRLLHCRDNATLQAFFKAVNFALRDELSNLPLDQRDWIPHFTTLIDLIDRFGSRWIGYPALKAALLTVYQIGRFIHFDTYPEAARSSIVGIWMGSFAAAAVACSTSANDLIRPGCEAVIAAFRTGFHSLLLQRAIACNGGINASPEHWSSMVSCSEDRALQLIDHVNAEARPSNSSKAYLSAIAPSSVTISGPPELVDLVVKSGGLKAHSIAVLTPYHAAHLSNDEDILKILGHLGGRSSSEHSIRIPIFSVSGNELNREGSFRDLLQQGIKEVLCEQLRWDTCNDRLSSLLGLEDEAQLSFSLFPVASDAAKFFSSTIQKRRGGTPVTICNTLNSPVERDQCRPSPGSFQDCKIAIVGYSGRYPEAASNDELWNKVLLQARNCVCEIPEDRFDWRAHYDEEGLKKNHTRVKYGCFINEPGAFDNRFFNLSPREAENTDPAQRLLLMATYEAMEMGGFVTDRTASTQCDRVGVFMGTTSDDWREVNSGQNVDTYFIPGGNRAFVPGRISYFFRFSGPAISVDTACSSSFAAISTACTYLWQGDCDTAIAGGTNVLTNPDNFVGLDRGHFLSTTGNCNPFDNSASGYCRADAVGSVILKRLDDALADNDPIFGVIAGASTNHCGQTVSITRPHEGDQLSLFKRILRNTNTDPADVGYVEMHGTGTQAGDAAEMRSVMSAFAPKDGHRVLPLHLGAIKGNVGHAESASGVTALIKVLMMMKHSLIPPHRLDGELNRNYPSDMSDRKVFIPFKATPWQKKAAANGRRMAFLNNFSAAGGNTALLLEDAPERSVEVEGKGAEDPRPVLPVALSAKTARSLSDNLRGLAAFLERHPETKLSSLSYTTTARRPHYNFRSLITAQDVSSLIASLKRRVDDQVKAVHPGKGGLVFAFTGQGTLYSGIGTHLFRHVSVFRDHLVRFARIAEQQGFPNILLLVDDDIQHVDAASLDPVVAQLSVTCIQMALAHLWSLWIGPPSAVIGHSLGEYAAMYSAGILSASDAIYLVGKRAVLMTQRCTKSTHSMLAVKAPLAEMSDHLNGRDCNVACVNSPSDTVVTGSCEEIEKLVRSLNAAKIETIPLDVPYAFHSSQIEPILPELESLASAISFNPPSVPFVSPLLGEIVTEQGTINGSYLARAARERVDFKSALEAARDSKLVNASTLWLELGIHPACSGMIKKTIDGKATTVAALRKGTNPWNVVMSAIETLYTAGADVHWNEFHRDFKSAQEVVQLPTYRWDSKVYWIQYQNNFCITKGDSSFGVSADQQSQTPISSSLHRVLEQYASKESSTLVVESDLHDPRLFPIVSGHKVNTAMLCPSSLYADMAMTATRHMLKAKSLYNEDIGLDCSDMTIKRPLIAKEDAESQLVRTTAKADWAAKQVFVTFSSFLGKAEIEHGSCMVKITTGQNWLDQWRRTAHLVMSRISGLRANLASGNSHLIKRGLAYKLFSSLVDYSPSYQGMQSVVLDSELLEATAQVIFQADSQGFEFNPCWIDSLGHIAGFIMNGNDNVYSKDQVWVNHGWEQMRCAKSVETGRTYTTYNQMQLESGTMYVGTTYVFDGDDLIAIFDGVRFQGVNRSVLDSLLPGSKQPVKSHTPKSTVSQKASKSSRKASDSDTSRSKSSRSTSASAARPDPAKGKSALQIIGEEIGMTGQDIDLNAEFTDLGVDSLMGLTISGRLKEECNIVASSSAFNDYTSVGEFIKHFGGDGATASPDTSTRSSSVNTRSSSIDTRTSSEDSRNTSIDLKEAPTPPTPQSELSAEEQDGDNVMKTVRKVISEETGADLGDLTNESQLSELGVDSLLSLTITGSLKEQLGTEFPIEMFADSETLGDVEMHLLQHGYITIKAPAETAASANTSERISLDEKAIYQVKKAMENVQAEKPNSASTGVFDVNAAPKATKVLLQGSPKSADKLLWLFPDGAGSAASYSYLPDVSKSVAIYGLNCPWLKTPDQLKCTLEQYVAKFLTEVLRVQPQGPYHFGGASAGGILAYEAAQQLSLEGVHVESLVLFDSPDPVGIENPNERMYDFLDSMGMFGMVGNKAPSWLRPHFNAFLQLLDAYEVQPFDQRKAQPPRVNIIYAKDGMCKNDDDLRPELREDDPREMKWLIKNRTDFSGAGWNSLVGSKNLLIETLDDVNHYTILQAGPKISEVAKFVAKALNV